MPAPVHRRSKYRELVIDEITSSLYVDLRCTGAGKVEAIRVELGTETNWGKQSSVSIVEHTCTRAGERVLVEPFILTNTVNPNEDFTISFVATVNGKGAHVARVYRAGSDGRLYGKASGR